MGTIDDLRTGISTLLASAGIGTYLTDPTAKYQPSDTAIVGATMPAAPDRSVALTLFPLTVNPVLPTNRYLLQIRSRGLPNDDDDAGDLDEAVMNALVGITNRAFGASTVMQVLFYSSVPLGTDAATRSTYSTKYFLDVDVPPTSLRPEGGAWD